MKPGLLIKAFKRLEPYDAKVSSTVLRGRRRRQLLLCYPTVKFLLCLCLSAFLAFADACCKECAKGHVCDSKKFEVSKESHSGTPEARYPQLLVFVSFSMPMEALKTLGLQANRLGGALVLRGLVDGNFKKTALKFKELGYSALIDPTLFETYKIEVVPTFVLRKRESDEANQRNVHDRMQGHVSLIHVFEQFECRGDVTALARILLHKIRKSP